MQNQIKEVISQGFKPVIFVDDFFASLKEFTSELQQIRLHSKELGIPVVTMINVSTLNRIRKAHVYRYGQIPSDTMAMVLRKKGRIVSGNLQPTLT